MRFSNYDYEIWSRMYEYALIRCFDSLMLGDNFGRTERLIRDHLRHMWE